MTLKNAMFAMTLCAFPIAAQAQHPGAMAAKPFAALQVIPIQNGPNSIDLDGDGVPDQVFEARRENYNAHDFSVFTFYANYPGPYDDSLRWHLVPFFSASANEEFSLGTSEGADCLLTDVWVVRDTSARKQGVEVIVGRRSPGASYITPGIVRFTLYRLAANDSGTMGWPKLSFRLQRTIATAKRFCDVDNAAASLGLPVATNPDAEGLGNP